MSSLVERLRDLGSRSCLTSSSYTPSLRDAADEIELLTAELEVETASASRLANMLGDALANTPPAYHEPRIARLKEVIAAAKQAEQNEERGSLLGVATTDKQFHAMPNEDCSSCFRSVTGYTEGGMR